MVNFKRWQDWADYTKHTFMHVFTKFKNLDESGIAALESRFHIEVTNNIHPEADTYAAIQEARLIAGDAGLVQVSIIGDYRTLFVGFVPANAIEYQHQFTELTHWVIKEFMEALSKASGGGAQRAH